ncbi:response regulator [Clostridium subterminale]|uniref:Stage 0 sporulation protein A homolog n=1 Tax=Clostridium subterminale TaxID=1550 RepID=A0ABN1KP01_CLOSU
MMDIIIVEDDINIGIILKLIIEDRQLGKVVEICTNPMEGEKQILKINPEIVLVDLLMPLRDGITVVNHCKKNFVKSKFIMISQVVTKDIIGKAYENGVEFYINKPINAIEVENVIKKVSDKIKVEQKLSKIEEVFNINNLESCEDVDTKNKIKNSEKNINYVMKRIGIIGEVGCKDIKNILLYSIKEDLNLEEFTLKELLTMFNKNYKSIEQRIRRTALIGMKSLANLGIEDYMNETFLEYSTSLYNFEEIKRQMDFIRGKRNEGGKVNVKKFLEGLILYCDKEK